MTKTVSRMRVATMLTLALLPLAGCASDGPAEPTAQPTPTPTVEAERSAMEQWNAAYDFLSAQTKDPEMLCYSYDVTADGTLDLSTAESPEFFGFDERDAWTGDTLTRHELVPGTIDARKCDANVPGSVPYDTAAIRSFLGQSGLIFGADEVIAAPGLDAVEIWYPGGAAGDTDSQYADAPGLWGLHMAMRSFEGVEAEDGSLIAPADEETAAAYLEAAQPALQWYGYEG